MAEGIKKTYGLLLCQVVDMDADRAVVDFGKIARRRVVRELGLSSPTKV